MAQAAMGRALVAAGGTMLVLGGGTMALSMVSMTATRVFMDRNKKKLLVGCPVCSGCAKLTCEVCRGERTVRYVPRKEPIPQRTQWSVCPLCEGTGEQACLNCLGEGQAMPLPAIASTAHAGSPGPAPAPEPAAPAPSSKTGGKGRA